MTDLVMIRHAPTAWNAEKRLQGHTDIPLTPESEAMVRQWSIPRKFSDFDWLTSPLSRAARTAELLYGRPVPIDERLSEMRYGDWEGEVLPDLRARLGEEMQDNEDKGLDFLPPGGESPRMVQDRLASLLQEIAERERSTVVVTHFGVIRAIFAKAVDWPMLGKPPVKILQARAHHFRLDPDGFPRVESMNIPLGPIDV
ncbi:histidine phosphatase family protein [Aestuariispira ectoiniformans]|uniref:histidine phosphatase family protein n=1 Tax=Aestuariispira ectoiniformans TaxID=2775080 RepID=UPI00223C178F|nr:histidine phosphatase family protein [Aestuariispira ectoiniformans]